MKATLTEIRVPVTDVPGLVGEHELAAWVFAPPAGFGSEPPIVLFCAPGGSYTKSYWHLVDPRIEGYSFAEEMADRGFLVVAFDHLGVGESSRPTRMLDLRTSMVAYANHCLVQDVMRRLRAGELTKGLDPASDACLIGIGHSMGGMLIERQQSLYSTFDAVAILGFSNLGWIPNGFTEEMLENVTEDSLAADPTWIPSPDQAADRAPLRDMFYGPNIPDALIEADERCATNFPGVVASAAIFPRYFLQDAANVDVPILLGFGEHDNTPDARGEAVAFISSMDITTHILSGAWHCTNFDQNRHKQWDRIGAWCQQQVRRNLPTDGSSEPNSR